jgi:hypothetical protein
MPDNVERKIFDMVEQGQITAEEGLRLINAMGGYSDESEPSEDPGNAAFEVVPEDERMPTAQFSEVEMRRMKRLKRWWVLPFGIGLIITTLGAVWMYAGYSAKGFGVGFWLAWIPFLFGIFVLALSFQTSHSVWLHVRIQQKPGEKPQRIAFSLPMPLSLTRWFLRTFGERIPGLKDQPLESYSEILNNLSPEEPFYVHVDDEDGESVEVFIG